jgi:hypothetical protein
MDGSQRQIIGGLPINQFFQAPPMERLRSLQAMQAGERSSSEDSLLRLLQNRPDVHDALMPDKKSKGTPESWSPFQILSRVLNGEQQ